MYLCVTMYRLTVFFCVLVSYGSAVPPDDRACPAPWPRPGHRKVGESCSCQMMPTTGLKVKCSYITNWPASTPNNTGELLLDGTRLNSTLSSYALAEFAPQLKKFSCSDCGIRVIQKFAFFGLNSLNILNLKDNDINTIQSFAFTGLRNLEDINLENCGIVTLEPNAFFSLHNVRYFRLSKNRLDAIKVDAFKNVSLIHQLTFNQMQAERLKSYTLKGLKHVSLISFTHSNLRKLEPYSFFGIDNITTINFHSSQIKDIMPYTFVGIGKVNKIFLRNTEVSTLSCDALEGLDCVRTIDWAMSPLRCDCNIQWMVELSANTSKDLTQGLRCASPLRFKGHVPFDLSKHEMGCNAEERFMGCPPLDTRTPRVKPLERYIEEVYMSASSQTTATQSLTLLLISSFSYFITLH